jgi:RNA polymerase sigma-70 factor (ECF subfamily)
MDEEVEFERLLAAAQTGDPQAMASLVEKYEPEVRMVARVRLGSALRPYLDSVDLVQSVHRSLMMGLRGNQYDITSPEKLVALATAIVRRKVARNWRKLQRQQRPFQEAAPNESVIDAFALLQSKEADPHATAALRDQLERIFAELDPVDQRLMRLRMEGHSTADAAVLLKLDPDVLRVRLSRLRRRLKERGLADHWL